MSQTSDFTTIGNPVGNIDVRLSYKIVELFSEGLYASPNKAIEELVANSFDAGAQKVAVFLAPDFHAQGAAIAVLDDGEGMDANALRQHWLIGISNKDALTKPPKGRNQIGKFGIGKLATYVLARRLTHVCKKDAKFYSTSMDYERIDKRVEDGVEPKTPIKIALRELTEDQAKNALAAWTNTAAFKNCGFKLFGKGAAPSWTFAILSSLKEKVHEIARGTLNWILRTALPLRPDFAIYLDGEKLEPSKLGKGRLKKWVIGKDIKSLDKPAPKGLAVIEDLEREESDVHRFGLSHPELGRITGYMEVYKDLLTGKSDAVDRSHGIFVYVRERLINIIDGHFGISPNDLKHGTFNRFRLVVYMEGLNDEIRSNRDSLRQGPVLSNAQSLFKALFNVARQEYEKYEQGEEPGASLARKLAGSPASLARRPIIELVRAALDGKIKSRYVALPVAATKAERESLVAALEKRAETPEQFVGGIDFVYDATSDDGIAIYDAATSRLRINGLHPFIGAFFDEFTSKTSGLPLEMFAMAEVLLESHLYQAGLKQDQIDEVMTARDLLLRHVAQESGRRTALTIANALRNARNDETQLEIEVVEAFRSLGFEATRKGRKGEPDGVAWAHLSPDQAGTPRRYSLTLEAKSKKKDGKKVTAATVDTGTIARHRDDYKCDHALVVGPSFPTAQGNSTALAKQIDADRKPEAGSGKVRTITLINVDDLARLVQLRPVKRLCLARIREMLTACRLPEECNAWIDKIEKETVAKPPYARIINAIHALQKEYDMAAVEYGALRVALGRESPPYKVSTNDELIELCKAMAAMASYEISATNRTVELNQSPANVLAAIEAATKGPPPNNH
jgi:hypothetical protein